MGGADRTRWHRLALAFSRSKRAYGLTARSRGQGARVARTSAPDRERSAELREEALDKARTSPRVFIIESLSLHDERNERFEGRILKQILRLGGKESRYYYIRTRRELEKIVILFGKSGFRYLHISCHGNTTQRRRLSTALALPTLGVS